MKLAIAVLMIASACGAQTKQCDKGEYQSVDGRCLHDRTGETYPAGDGCNSSRCMDAACHLSSTTAVYCAHGDDPAWPPATFPQGNITGETGITDGPIIQQTPLIAGDGLVKTAAEPLTCPKNQHVEHGYSVACGNNDQPPCLALPKDMCVDDAQPAPLTCGKYQHAQYTPAHCANTCGPYGTACTTQCLYVAEENVCVDDLHTVTEREWQEMLARLKKLESEKSKAEAYRGIGLKSSKIAEQCLHDLGVCTDRMDTARKTVQGIIDGIDAKAKLGGKAK